MSIESVIRTAIEETLEGITGLKVAPFIPEGINHYDMPIAIVTPRRAVYQLGNGAEIYIVARTWEIAVIIAGQGTRLNATNQNDILTQIENIQGVLLARRRLGITTDNAGTRYVVTSLLTGDSGMTGIPFGNATYLGVIFELSVTYNRYQDQTK